MTENFSPHFTYTDMPPGRPFQPPGYLVTLIVADQRYLLGRRAPQQLRLTCWGRIVSDCWLAIPARFPHSRLDAFQILPDRLQGILWPGAGEPLREVVRGFQTAVTRAAHLPTGAEPAFWQRRGYARPLRSRRQLEEARRHLQRQGASYRPRPSP